MRTKGQLTRIGKRHFLARCIATFIVASVLCSTLVGSLQAAARGPLHVNHTVPTVEPPAPLVFSSLPTDAEFLHTGLFAEPLAPVAATTPEENRALAKAILAYRDATQSSGASDAVDPLLTFLGSHPDSAWAPALQLNLGIVYRQTGHFSKALDIWQAGWTDAHTLSDPHGRALANAIVARLSQLEAYLGRKELLAPLLDSIRARSIGGSATQLVTDSHFGLYDMVYHPEDSFRCGPLALTRILKHSSAQPSPAALRVLENAHSTPSGLSLTMVRDYANQAGMRYQTAFRETGAPMILPAVAHWKVGHFAAVIDRDNNNRYLVQDTTFIDDIRMSPVTLDEEASGYFLVPEGELPSGWRAVSDSEADKVWGRGSTGLNHDVTDTGTNPSCQAGCTTASVELQVVGLQLTDIPVGYTPPRGPAVKFGLVYSHRDALQPTTFSYSNFGPKWTFNWLSYVTDTISSTGNAQLYRRGGGAEPFTFASSSATTAYPGPYSQAVLTRTVNGSGSSTGFVLTHPDGSYEQYEQAVGSQFFMTAVSDAAGNMVTLTYDSSMRVVAITDAVGQVTTLSYGLSASPLVVTKISDPFGRSASFTYNSSGQLASITDVLGITSSYTYSSETGDPDFINTLTTPYGSTTFTFGDVKTDETLGSTRFLKTVDPLGRTSYVEFDDYGTGSTNGIPGDTDDTGELINSSLAPTGMFASLNYLFYRNTFVFDANQYALATANGGLNYSLGKVIHWLHDDDVYGSIRVKESEKEPLENRVWYNYPGQDGDNIVFPVSTSGVVTNGASNLPSAIGRVLDDGTTQLLTFAYNSNGNATQVTDPIGRQLTYTYAANGIDRLTTTNTTNGVSQLLETRTYNTLHEPLTIIRANGKTSHYAYNGDGQVTKYTDALGHATTMSYDSSGHLRSVTGAISTAKYSYAYDEVSRIASVTDPAGSTVHFAYDAADRPTKATYPDGTTAQLSYTLLDLTKSTDRLNQTTRYTYDSDRELTATTDPLGHTVHQGYNLAGKLSSITDPNSHSTTLTLDAESRVTGKTFANGTSVSVAYDSSLSRVATVTDALSQTTDYTYNQDNTLATVSYSSTQSTPSVSFTYDTVYPRITSMSDGVGITNYSYYPVTSSPALGANLLESVMSPIAGASGSDVVVYSYDALNRVVGQTINGVAQSFGFDAIGRSIATTNALDSFTYGYSDGTSRATSVSSNLGPTSALSYFGPTGDELLEQMNVTTHSGGTSLAQFGYTYNSDEIVKSATVSSPSAQTTAYGYDAANRLISGLISGSTPQYAYGYDNASNLTSISPNGATESFSYTSTNSITNGTHYANGSPLVLGSNTYKWDGANRVVRFTNSVNKTSSSFIYDGLSRLVRVVDTTSGAISADHSYTWCGATRCLAHDNTQSGSPVSTEYFPQGAIIGGTSYYYVRDRLGSVTELVSAAGTVVSQFTYDPYGNRTNVSGTVIPDVGYAGYFFHSASGLDFAMYRAYDPTHSRWLNRDPIGESGGVDLYAYANANPATERDPSGEFGVLGAGIGAAVGGIGNLAYQLYNNGGKFHCVSWTQVGAFALGGAVIGSGLEFAYAGLSAEAAESVPLGFADVNQFRQACAELCSALTDSGISDFTIGVRGSSITGVSFDTGLPFSAASDIDFFVVSPQFADFEVNSYGMVYSGILEDAFPAIAEWSEVWTEILGREVSVAGFPVVPEGDVLLLP